MLLCFRCANNKTAHNICCWFRQSFRKKVNIFYYFNCLTDLIQYIRLCIHRLFPYYIRSKCYENILIFFFEHIFIRCSIPLLLLFPMLKHQHKVSSRKLLFLFPHSSFVIIFCLTFAESHSENGNCTTLFWAMEKRWKLQGSYDICVTR